MLLPYAFLKYSFSGRFQNVTYQIIDPDTILRPCIVVRDADRKWNFSAASRRTIKDVRYWGIRHATTDRGIGYGALTDDGNDDELVQAEQRPLILGSRAIQAIYETHREGSSGDVEYEQDNGFELSDDDEESAA